MRSNTFAGPLTARIATVTMDRPPVNAVNQQMYKELEAAFGSGSPFVDSSQGHRAPWR